MNTLVVSVGRWGGQVVRVSALSDSATVEEEVYHLKPKGVRHEVEVNQQSRSLIVSVADSASCGLPACV